MNPTRIVAAYFFAQAIVTAAWWGVLVACPASVKWFLPGIWQPESLLSFWLADFMLIVGGSASVGIGILRRARWASIGVWGMAAVTWYPTLVCLAASLLTGEAWIASSMMVSMAGLSLAMATVHGNPSQSPAAIRAVPMNRGAAVLWTLGQTVVFWGAFLWVLPMGIVELQRHVDWGVFQHPYQTSMSVVLFAAASVLGLSSGVMMATRGNGTPLPTATASRLVIVGPYRYVRNPMAVAGILQGIGVGWYLGSMPVIAYSLVGAVLWHVGVRPVEERDLSSRFGDSYRSYRSHVGLWCPRLRMLPWVEPSPSTTTNENQDRSE